MRLALGAVALVQVIPVNHPQRPIGPADVHDLARLVVEIDEVRAVVRDVAAALALQHVHVDARAVDVVHEHIAADAVGPARVLRDAQARVCVAAARRVAAVVAAVRRGAEEMTVIGDGLDVVVGVRVEMLPGLPLVARPG